MVYVHAPAATNPDDDRMLAAFKAVGLALSARAILAMSIAGAIGLGVFVMAAPELLRVIALGVYAALVILPMVWLERNKR